MAFLASSIQGAINALSLGQLADFGLLGRTKYGKTIDLLNQKGGSVGCKVSFYGANGSFALNGRTGVTRDDTTRLDTDIMEVTTDKDMESPCGSFSMTLFNRKIRQDGPFKGKYLQDVVSPMDLVVIGFRRDDQSWVEMIGVVSARPAEQEAPDENGARVSRVSIVGFDLGKLLLNASICYFRNAPNKGLIEFTFQGWATLDKGQFPKGSKAKVMLVAIQLYLYRFTGLAYRSPEFALAAIVGPELAVTVQSLLGYRLGQTYGELPGMNLFENEQTLYNFMANIAEKPWCELFVDTVPDDDAFLSAMVPQAESENASDVHAFDGAKAMIFLRETPFDQAAWEALPLFIVTDEVIKNVSLGGEPTVYNVFHAQPTDYGSLGDLQNKGITGDAVINNDSVNRHGFRPMVAETKTIAFDATVPTIQQTVATFTNKLLRWFGLSDQFISGSITVQGNGLYRIGTRLRRIYLGRGEAKAMEFYIEGKSSSWNCFDDYTCTLHLTRGLPATTAIDRSARYQTPVPEMVIADFSFGNVAAGSFPYSPVA